MTLQELVGKVGVLGQDYSNGVLTAPTADGELWVIAECGGRADEDGVVLGTELLDQLLG